MSGTTKRRARTKSPSPRPSSKGPRSRSSSRPIGTRAWSSLPAAHPDYDCFQTMTMVMGMSTTAVMFYWQSAALSGSFIGKGGAEESTASAYITGLGFSSLAVIGSTSVGALRKIVSAREVGSVEQVGVACLVQGVFALVHCVLAGEIGLTVSSLPSGRFWLAAAGSSSLLVLVKTLETRAYAESDISLCAPFLAFDPVMQLFVGVVFMPLLCPLLSLGCEDADIRYPWHHLLALVCVAMGAFFLGMHERKSGRKLKAGRRLGPLPVGSWYILFNCFIYGFTSRIDRVAISASSKTVYYAWGRLIMACTALGGAALSGSLTAKGLRRLLNPVVLILVLLTCAADALYQLSQYQAMARISPVYVTAIKRGGGILLSSLIGALVFAESLHGRLLPILTIVAGVVFMCL